MERIRRILKNTNGFTLVELIVVIAIIGILVAIAVPKISGFTDSAKLTNDKQLAKILENTVRVLIANGSITLDDADTSFTVANNDNNTALVYTPTDTGPLDKDGNEITAVNTLSALITPYIDSKAKISQAATTMTVIIEPDGDVRTTGYDD